MKVVIIGTGNVATIFGRKIVDAGHQVQQVVGRNPAATTELAYLLKAKGCYNILNINESCDIYLVAVADKGVQEVVQNLQLNGKIIVHTAASVSKEVLKQVSENYGVIYPIQSIKKEVDVMPPIPVLVDGSNPATLETLSRFASQWADSVTVATDEERAKLHVAAVVVNNFSNHLFALAKSFCVDNGLNFKALEPLIKETVERIQLNDPALVQTGPAVRKDMGTIEKHKAYLEDFPNLLSTYKCLTDSIISFHAK